MPTTSDASTGLPAGVYRKEPTGEVPPAPVPDAAALASAARGLHAAHPPTPLVSSRELSRRFGRDVHLKLEGLSAVRSYKWRGAMTAVAAAVAEHPGGGIVTASTGNHGQGIAYAGAAHGVPVTVAAPTTILPEKLAAMRALGAEVIVEGPTLTEAEHLAKDVAGRTGATYLEDGESPHLMAGAASVVLEMLEQVPGLDTIIVPVGGGNLIAASLLAARDSGTAIVGAQSTAASGATASWLAGEVVVRPCTTYAGGLATERPGALSLEVMTRLLSTMVLVDDDDLRRTTADAFVRLGLVVEGAAAAGLAALALHPDATEGDRIGVVVSGSWLSSEQLREALTLE